jgi:hypothetical protein
MEVAELHVRELYDKTGTRVCVKEKWRKVKYVKKVHALSRTVLHAQQFTLDHLFVVKSRDSSVSIVIGCGLDSHVLIPSKGKIFLFSVMSSPALRPTQFPVQWVSGALSPRLQQPESETDNSPPSSAEVKNGGAKSPLPHMSSWHNA